MGFLFKLYTIMLALLVLIGVVFSFTNFKEISVICIIGIVWCLAGMFINSKKVKDWIGKEED